MNKPHYAIAAVLMTLTLAAPACHDPGSGAATVGGINFVDGIAVGKAQAQAQTKPMFVYFTGDY
jgi:hypothetical protein